MALLQSTSPNIRTLTDLLNSDMELAADDTPYGRYFLSTNTEPIRKKMYDTKIAPPGEPSHFVNMSYGIGMVRKGFYAFHNEVGIGFKYIKDTFLEHEKCGLSTIRFFQTKDPLHTAPKNSPYKEIFKVKYVQFSMH